MHRDNDVSLQLCPVCGGEGRIFQGSGYDGDLMNSEQRCEECEGTGGALVPVELIDLDDLAALLSQELREVAEKMRR